MLRLLLWLDSLPSPLGDLVAAGLVALPVYLLQLLVDGLAGDDWSLYPDLLDLVVSGLAGVIAAALRRVRPDFIGTPPEGPCYAAAEMRAQRADWHGALDLYRGVLADYPQDAEALWRIAELYRHRLGEPERYVLTLRRIVNLPDDAEPAWIVREAQHRLAQADPLECDPGARARRAPVTLPDEEPFD